MSSEEHNSPGAQASEEEELPGVDRAPGRQQKARAAQDAPQTNGQSAGEAATGAEAPEDVDEPVNELEAKAAALEEAQKKIQELEDSWRRERADFQNFRKRTQTEKTRIRAEATAGVVHELLAVLDNLDRVLGIQTTNEEVKQYVAGVEMIRQSFLSALEKYRIRPVHPEGQPFDPMTMEAIAIEERGDLQQDTVLEIYQSGYVMEHEDGERQTLRPARVKVGKAGGKGASGSSGTDQAAAEESDGAVAEK